MPIREHSIYHTLTLIGIGGQLSGESRYAIVLILVKHISFVTA
jgi:hypothetical protein